VELHGGNVEALSEGVGRGSEFVVRLPEAIEMNGSGRPTVDPDSLPSDNHGLNHRILLVDDNKDAADSLALLLEFTQMEVHVVYDGESAIKAARTLLPTVVVLDIGLPDISGYEVARRLRSDPAHQKLMLVALSGWGQAEDKRKSREAGIDHHLVKPVDFKKLRSLLELGKMAGHSV
jgi:CheY-like chemotaxis protein